MSWLFPISHRSLSSISIFAGFTALIVSGLILTNDLSKYHDLDPHDESAYLEKSLGGPTSIDWGPLYGKFLSIYQFFEEDFLKRYYLNQQVLTIALPITVFLGLALLKVPIFLSLIFSYCLLLSSINAFIQTKIGHFSTIAILIGTIASVRMRKELDALTVLSITALTASLIRPEFILCYAIFLIVALAYAASSRILTSRSFYKFLICQIITYTIISMFFEVRISDRNTLAFRQNFNHVSHLYQLDVDGYDQYEKYFSQDNSILSALFDNPEAWINHVERSMGLWPEKFIEAFFYHPNIVEISEASGSFISSMETVGLILVLLFIYGVKRTANPSVNIRPMHYYACFVFIIPPLLSSLLYQPTLRYFTPIVSLTVFTFSLLFQRVKTARPLDLLLVFVLSFSFIYITPNIGDIERTRHVLSKRYQQTPIIHEIRSLRFEGPIHCLTYPSLLGQYFGADFDCIPYFFGIEGMPGLRSASNGQSTLDSYVKDQKINTVIVTDQMKDLWEKDILDLTAKVFSRGWNLFPVSSKGVDFILTAPEVKVTRSVSGD